MLTELLAALLINESNFKVMHWMSKGHEFDSIHKNITTEYYDMCDDNADKVAEMCIRLDIDPLNYREALEVAEKSDKKFIIVKSDKDYSKDEIIETADHIFRTILELIEACLQEDEIAKDIKNVGIKAELESMHSEFDLQFRYINARRK